MSLKEDTVSADRKERIIFDPEAWKSKDKSGRKTSAITSRQNFDNEKFTRKNQDQVDEGTIQPSGDSKVDSAGPTQSDTISKDKPKKSNNPQIEFVSGTAQPNGSSSTAIGGAQATGRKIAEALVKKAITQVKTDKNVGTEEIPFDGPYTKSPSTVVDKSGAKHTPYSRVRALARQAMKKQSCKEEVERIDEKDAPTNQFKQSSTSRPVAKPRTDTGYSHPAAKPDLNKHTNTGISKPGVGKENKFPEPRKPSFHGDHGSKSETLGHDGRIYHWQDPRAKKPVVKEAEQIEERVTFDKDGNKIVPDYHKMFKTNSDNKKAAWHAKYPDANDHEKALINHGLGHIVHNLRNPGSAVMKSAPSKPAVKEETSLEEGSPIFHAIRQNTHDLVVNYGRRREEGSEEHHKQMMATSAAHHQSLRHHWDQEMKRREADTHDRIERQKIARAHLKKGDGKPASDPHIDAMHAVIRDRVARYKRSTQKESVDLQLEYEIHHDGNGNYRDDEGNEWSGKSGPHNSSFGRRKTITSNVPHAVHINGKKWKTFGSQSHAQNVANKIKGATVHKEEIEFSQEETDMSKKTYTQFVEQLLEYTPGPGGVTRVQGKSYGANYDAGEDEDDKPAKPAADAPKRGRGRPAGSKSGANLKVTKGKSYGGIATHSLNLPNSNR